MAPAPPRDDDDDDDDNDDDDNDDDDDTRSSIVEKATREEGPGMIIRGRGRRVEVRRGGDGMLYGGI